MNKGLSIPSLCRKLTDYGSFLIFTHASPDSDTLGSALALKRMLDVSGRRTEVVCGDRIPERLKFLTGTEDMSVERLNNFVPDCRISVDVADPALLGGYKDYAEKIDICIDHHERRCMTAKYMLIESASSSCGEIIYLIGKQFEKMKVCSVDDISAGYIYAAISGDTGGFVYSNVTQRTHRIASDLMKYSVDFAEINERLHKRTTKQQLALKAELISNMNFYADDRVAGVYIDAQTRKDFGLLDKDTGDIVNIPREVEGVDIAFSVKEDSDGKFKVSFRTKSADAAKLAAIFGGGGHKRAAGCTVRADSIGICLSRISEACIEELSNV